MNSIRIRPRRLCAAGAMALGLALGSTTPATADPVVHPSDATTVTFSDDTLDPGQILTVTVDIHFTVTSEGSIGDVELADNGNWTFVSCDVGGAATSCGYDPADRGSRFFWTEAPSVDASATFRFAVAADAAGTIPYTGLITTDPASLPTVEVISGTLAVNALTCTTTGTNGPDHLIGTSGADVICGGNGNDTIEGGDGADVLAGGNGSDVIHAGGGDDVIGGGPGDDSVHGDAGDDVADGRNGDDTVVDHSGTDTVVGRAGDDVLDVRDGAGGDTADGGHGADTCTVDGGDTAIDC